jgi:hypothetical protein
MDDLTRKIQSTLRTVTPKDDRPRGRSEFASVRELVNYILDEDAKAAGKKSSERK